MYLAKKLRFFHSYFYVQTDFYSHSWFSSRWLASTIPAGGLECHVRYIYFSCAQKKHLEQIYTYIHNACVTISEASTMLNFYHIRSCVCVCVCKCVCKCTCCAYTGFANNGRFVWRIRIHLWPKKVLFFGINRRKKERRAPPLGSSFWDQTLCYFDLRPDKILPLITLMAKLFQR